MKYSIWNDDAQQADQPESPRLATGDVQTRWWIHQDMDQVEYIDRHLPEPWGVERFCAYLRTQNIIGSVAECRTTGELLAAYLFQLERNRIELLYLAVLPVARRLRVGTACIDSLKQRANTTRRRVQSWVPAKATDLQLLLQASGFRAIDIDRAADAYLMDWSR